MLPELTVVMIHFQTPDLLMAAVHSFRDYYPEETMVIFDNGSQDGSKTVVKSLTDQYPGSTQAVYLEKNIFHGPAMDLAMRSIQTPYVFFMDTDVLIKKGEFLESMMSSFQDADVYGVGRLNQVNKRGFTSNTGTTIILTPYMMIRRSLYPNLPPFKHHGMPTLSNFSAAGHHGYRFASFPIDDYIDHFGRGTAGRYGYQLGLKGRWSYVMNKLGL